MSVEANSENILRPGQIVASQYRVDWLIAKGGMAAVWAGVNEHTGKRVALKVILRSFAANDEAAELFRLEALSASKVNHPNVISIFDVVHHEGMTCIVMEVLDGETLGTYLARNGALSLETTTDLLLPAMRGVAAANAQGVVHRDLKPSNIFLCSSPSGQLITTKVLDFGISVMMKRVGEAVPMTERLAMFGTPAYMAPEAIEFSPNIDGRADVYSFGVLFFEALAGKLPFPGQPGPELFKRILNEPPPLVTLYRPDLSPDVADLIARALAKSPDDRFPDMDHLIHAAESRLIPLLPTQRSLTPLSGILLLPLADPTNAPAAPAVRAPLKREPPRPLRQNETRVLYSMASQPRNPCEGTASTREALPAIARALEPREEVPQYHRKRHLTLAAAFVVFSAVTAWVAIPASSSDRGQKAALPQQPSLIEPAVAATVAPVGGRALVEIPSVPAEEHVVPQPLPEVFPPSLPTEARNEPTIELPAIDVAGASSRTIEAQQHAKRGSLGRSPNRQTRTPDSRHPAFRAGSLSPSDF
jgi:serine/threonine-protein kinase